MVETLEESRRAYDDGYYEKKLEEGLAFQDFVTRELYKHGIVIVGYASKYSQLKYGENKLGAEIKRDGRFRETGNLYIEVAEKSHPDRPEFVDSGIERPDGSWLLIIGDERDFWMFSIKYLRLLVKQKNWQEVKTPTSIGHLCPLEDADHYCLRRFPPTDASL